MYKLIVNNRSTQLDITNIVGYIKRRSNESELAEQLDFNIAYSDINLPKVNINDGDLIAFYDDAKELFRGIILTSNSTGRAPLEYNCMDFGFYLNKDKEIYQFDCTAANAIKKICNDFQVPIGNIIYIPTKIKKIYTGTLSDTIKDILDQAEKDQGTKYRFEMREGKFYVEEKIGYIIRSTTNLFGNDVDITKLISSPSRKRSIEDMRNSIKIVQSSEENVTILATAKDDSLINTYGLLQEVQSIDEVEIVKAKNIASNLLKDLGKITEELSLELIGDDDVRSGRVLEITEEVTGMKGLYLVTDCTHTYEKSIHKMQLGLELI